MTPTHRYNGIKSKKMTFTTFFKGESPYRDQTGKSKSFQSVRRRIKIISVRRLPGAEVIITLLQENMIIQIMKFMR